MLTNLLFHTLKGISGWSSCALSNIDIARIINVSYSKRIFRIFDRDKLYSIQIKYDLPHETTTITSVFSNHGGGISVVPYTELTQIITKRYTTEQECIDEINAINSGKEKLNKMKLKMQNEINSL